VVFTAVKIQVEGFWVVMPSSVVAASFFPEDGALKCWCPSTTLHGITTQNILTCLTYWDRSRYAKQCNKYKPYKQEWM